MSTTTVKVLKWTWEELADVYELPKDVERARMWIRFGMTSQQATLSRLFSLLLAPDFDEDISGGPGLSRNVGTIVFRLSDSLSEETRRLVWVGADFEDGCKTVSLEEWRQNWLNQYDHGEADVPIVMGELPLLPVV